MSGVVERQTAPTVDGVQGKASVARVWLGQGVEAIIMTGRTVGDVPRELGVVELRRVDGVVVERSVALVGMHVASDDKVDGILQEQRLKDILAADAERGVGLVDIPRSVQSNNNPWSLLSINRSEILGQPIRLLVHVAGKGTSIILLASTRRVG